MSALPKTAYIVMGPTASGKTAFAIALAQHFNTEIISADSRQCYAELSIGVARPSLQELSTLPHHFIASHSIHEKVDVAVFEQYAISKAEDLFQTHDQIVLCGGTGLYINAFCNGIDDIPEIEADIRQQVEARWKEAGIQGLQEWVASVDPIFWEQTQEPDNRVRLMRALEVKLATGNSILTFQKGHKATRAFEIKKIYIDWPRETLYQRINQRVDLMIAQGLLDEVKQVFPYRHLKALQTVGYQELVDHLEGKTSFDQAVALIKQHTRNYAKRQVTWFKKQGWDILIKGEALIQGSFSIDAF